MTPRVRVLRVRGKADEDIPLPGFATPGSAGADLRAAIEGEWSIEPGARALVPTGLALAIPAGFEGQVRPRSGLALEHGISLPNAPGTIDSDYRGELKVLLQNGGNAPFRLRRGDRIAQLVIAPVVQPHYEEVDDARALGASARGAGGFGHSGTS